MDRAFLIFNEEEQLAALRAPTRGGLNLYLARNLEGVAAADVADDRLLSALEGEGVEVVPALQYAPVTTFDLSQVYAPTTPTGQTLRDVLDHIKAPAAWRLSRARGVHIAVVDTGVAGTMAEFPAWKRSPHSWAYDGSPWTDHEGHGSMVACIAAGSADSGGRYDGVAPDAQIIPCKTTFLDTELFEIYDFLIGLVDDQRIERLVINNSFGVYARSAPTIDAAKHPFIRIIRAAVARGIVVVFAAGNNHVRVGGHDPAQCAPNSIWAANSLDEVIAVGTVNALNDLHAPPPRPTEYSHCDSSRGPGQLAHQTIKPDCVAPTYGEVVWGDNYQTMGWWGTSGAAPQVSGLAALMLAHRPSLTPEELALTLTGTCVPLPLGGTCVGKGLIDCAAALAAL